jgi:hypothetical protein
MELDKQKIIRALDTLREYNKWRRGKINESPNASSIGESIDYVIEFISTEVLNKK